MQHSNHGLRSVCAKHKLAVLLPITSRNAGQSSVADTVVGGLGRLAASLTGQSGLATVAESPQHTHSSDCDSHSELSRSLVVLIGIDSNDSTLLQHQKDIVSPFDDAGVPAKVLQFSEADREGKGPGPVCHLWSILARAAVDEGCSLAVLLGDDTEVQPAGWPQLVVSEFEQQPQLMLLMLKDDADPGFPSFPVLRVDRHLKMFGSLLPSCFVNQGGDPYLAALYRRWHGCVRMLPDVTVINHIGGVQHSDVPFVQPRYARTAVSKKAMLTVLQQGTQVLQATAALGATSQDLVRETCSKAGDAGIISQAGSSAMQPAAASHSNSGSAAEVQAPYSPEASGSRPKMSCFPDGMNSSNCSSSLDGATHAKPAASHTWCRQLAVDVLVPTARVDLELLEGIADAVLTPQATPAGADLHFILVVDQPCDKLSGAQKLWLQQLQAKWLDRVRVRFNDSNMGASATRNRALQESLAEYVILWDDDIKPSASCLAAYVEAFMQHPHARGFAGPTYIPKDPSNLWCCAVHHADVLFFWDAAADWRVVEVMPWAVTANVALINTPALFDLKFPKTGGGEDIDYCVKVTGGRLVPVPQASVHHPLWNGGRRCYNRFFGWAYGDGALIPMYPHLCYWAAPSSAEACCALLLLSIVAATAAVVSNAAAQAITMLLSDVSTAAGGLSVPKLSSSSMAENQEMVTESGSTMLGLERALQLAAACAPAAAGGAVIAWRASYVLLAAVVAYKLTDVVLDVARAFTPERISKHPCSSWWLRVLAAAEASLIKTWSECGRLWGLLCRGELLHGTVCRRFDWFAGLSADIVKAEQRTAACRFILCTAAAIIAATAASRLG